MVPKYAAVFLLWLPGWGFSIAISTHVPRMVAQSSLYEVIRHMRTNAHCCFSSLAFRLGIFYSDWHKLERAVMTLRPTENRKQKQAHVSYT